MTTIMKILSCVLLVLVITTVNTIMNDTNIDVPIVENTTDITPEIVTQVDKHADLFTPKGNLLNNYADNSCEIIARTFQKEYNGHLVFIAPLKASTGAWIQSRYSGHWLNQIYHDNKTIFVDYDAHRVYYDEITLHDDMQYSMQNKFNSDDIDVKIYIAGIDAMPYPIMYN